MHKKKPGRPRLPPGSSLSSSTLRTRASRDRQAKRKLADEIATDALLLSVKSMGKEVNDETLALAERNTQEAMRLLLEQAPEIIRNLADRAKSDTAAAALLIKYLLPPASRVVRFRLGESADTTAHSILSAAAEGQMSVDDASATLELLDKAGNVALSGAIVSRINALRGQIQAIKANGGGNVTANFEIVDMGGNHEPEGA